MGFWSANLALSGSDDGHGGASELCEWIKRVEWIEGIVNRKSVDVFEIYVIPTKERDR
jgi:hypothetical protein